MFCGIADARSPVFDHQRVALQAGKASSGSKALIEKLVREIQKVQEQLRTQTAARQRAEGDAATADHEAKAAVSAWNSQGPLLHCIAKLP